MLIKLERRLKYIESNCNSTKGIRFRKINRADISSAFKNVAHSAAIFNTSPKLRFRHGNTIDLSTGAVIKRIASFEVKLLAEIVIKIALCGGVGIRVWDLRAKRV